MTRQTLRHQHRRLKRSSGDDGACPSLRLNQSAPAVPARGARLRPQVSLLITYIARVSGQCIDIIMINRPENGAVGKPPPVIYRISPYPAFTPGRDSVSKSLPSQATSKACGAMTWSAAVPAPSSANKARMMEWWRVSWWFPSGQPQPGPLQPGGGSARAGRSPVRVTKAAVPAPSSANKARMK